MNALKALVRKDIVLYFANRRAVLVTVVAPILIAAFFGAVLGGPTTKPSRVPVAIVDLDSSAVSKAIVASMKSDTTFDLRETGESEARRLVREGKVRAAAIVPAGFGEDAPRAMFRPNAKKPEIAVLYDPSQAMALAVVKGLLVEHVMKQVSREAFNPDTGRTTIASLRADVEKSGTLDEGRRHDLLSFLDSVERLQAERPAGASNEATSQGLAMPFETRETEVAGNRQRNYNGYAHSFAGMGVQFILFMGIELGVGLLMMRRLGMWKRLRAAPLSRAVLLGSRIVSGAAIASIIFALIYAAAIALFGVRIDGSLIGFVAVAIAFAILTSTFGLLIAALGRTPEATRGIAILATLLLVMLGGAWVPTFVFPQWLQRATLVVPTRWAIDGLEAMTWRGLGLEAAWPPVIGMLAVSALFGWIAIKRFAWEE
ncbi:MAG: ABC transporter permease [Bacillota bacterium]